MKVARHEVPGNALFRRSRPVGNGVVGLAPAAIPCLENVLAQQTKLLDRPYGTGIISP